MNEFTESREVYKHSLRGTYIIIPLKYSKNLKLPTVKIDNAVEKSLSSDSWSDLLVQRYEKSDCYGKRFVLDNEIREILFDDGGRIPVDEVQLFMFDNQIAFLTAFLVYENEDVQYVYKFVNPGYVNDEKEYLRKQIVSVVNEISVGGQKGLFKVYVSSEELAIKEAYLFNAAMVEKRFLELETIDRITFNEHKLIDLSRDFKDPSEQDITYVYGAKDIEQCSYRWGTCISSQSISYVYANEDKESWNAELIKQTAEEDLLLTMLVLYQKNTCKLLSEEIQNTLSNTKKPYFLKDIIELKRQALLFRASSTLAPSQVSRWNNVCETYRNLLEVNGVNEALEEIEQKIDLIKDEQERKAAEIQNYIATVIAVFGLISIIAAVLQIVDLMESGSTEMLATFWLSCLGIVMLGISWVVMMVKRK